MSFFDEGDEPSTSISSPPPESRRRVHRRSRPTPIGPVDNRTLLARRVGAAGAVVVVVLLLYLGVSAYLSSQARDAVEAYNTEVTTLATLQSSQVETPVFSDLNAAATENAPQTDLPVQLYELGEVARSEANEAEGWSVPSQMVGAQTDLLLALNMRYEAIDQMSREIAAAYGTSGQTVAFEQLAGAMQMLKASDSVWPTQVQPLIEQGLESAGVQLAGTNNGIEVSGQLVVDSKVLPDDSWMLTSYVASKLLGYEPGVLGGAAPTGTNGHTLTGVTVNGSQLSTTTITDLTYVPGMAFDLVFQNTGTNDEFGVQLKIQISAASVPGIVTGSATQPETVPGMTYTVPVTLTSKPAIGTPLSLTAQVVGVRGETDTANNKATYDIEFTG